MKTKYLLLVLPAVLIFACNESNRSRDYAVTTDLAKSDSAAADIAKIIKTADMRFRVKNVQKSKEALSSEIKNVGGTVTEVSIQSYVQNTEKVKYSTDSLLEITSYNTQGIMVARVLSEKLDEFTNRVAKMAVFVDNQSLKMDDQSIAYLQNRLKAKNRTEAIDQINKQATKKGTNVESSLYIKDDYIDKKIDNMVIDDKVKFSTITLNFYQDNTVTRLVVGNDNLSDYRPGFFRRLGLNLAQGWVIFKEFLLAIANLWMLILLAAVLYYGIRYYMRKRKARLISSAFQPGVK